LYSADPSTLDPDEQRSFRDDIVSILRRVEDEIAQSGFEVQRNWFTRAKEKIEEGIALFDQRRLEELRACLDRRRIFSGLASPPTRERPISWWGRTAPRQKMANKAPEPTTTAVTPRAMVCWNHHTICGGARVAPAVVVAHL